MPFEFPGCLFSLLRMPCKPIEHTEDALKAYWAYWGCSESLFRLLRMPLKPIAPTEDALEAYYAYSGCPGSLYTSCYFFHSMICKLNVFCIMSCINKLVKLVRHVKLVNFVLPELIVKSEIVSKPVLIERMMCFSWTNWKHF